jgi:hypothetical protein
MSTKMGAPTPDYVTCKGCLDCAAGSGSRGCTAAGLGIYSLAVPTYRGIVVNVVSRWTNAVSCPRVPVPKCLHGLGGAGEEPKKQDVALGGTDWLHLAVPVVWGGLM